MFKFYIAVYCYINIVIHIKFTQVIQEDIYKAINKIQFLFDTGKLYDTTTIIIIITEWISFLINS